MGEQRPRPHSRKGQGTHFLCMWLQQEEVNEGLHAQAKVQFEACEQVESERALAVKREGCCAACSVRHVCANLHAWCPA
eukprot:1776489-Pleurochrysis_carterae.AAC.1